MCAVMRTVGIVACVGFALILAGRALAHCGDGTVTRGEACDAGTPLCQGGTNAGSECHTSSDCPGGGTCACTGPAGTGSCTDGVGNRDDIADACRANCMLPMCGDGVSDSGEQCDEGASNGDDKPCLGNAPRSACATAAGAIFLNPLIPGATVRCTRNADCALVSGGTATCTGNPQCRLNVCGDGRTCSDRNCTSGSTSLLGATPGWPAPEVCDDGNTSDTDNCTSFDFAVTLGATVVPQACQVPVCGDGVTNGNEQCDSGFAVCLTGARVGKVCTTANDCTVGNLVGTCSAGNRNDVPNGCRTTCGVPFCGDGISDPGEGCDDGNTANIPQDFCNEVRRCQGGEGPPCGTPADPLDPAGPRNPPYIDCVPGAPGSLCNIDADCIKGTCGKVRCAQNACGDGVVNGNEECDDGNTVVADTAHPYDTCGMSPTYAAANPKPPGCIVTPLENLPNACIPAACRGPRCGDGVVSPGEDCDAGQATCNALSFKPGAPCTRNSDCPGGSGAACGPGNRDDVPDACRSSCKAPFCGDAVLDSGEQCDDGTDNGDSKPCVQNLGATGHCILNTCGDAKVCFDATCTSGPVCDAFGQCVPGAGPGAGGPEQCDDGPTPTTRCADCIASTCGDLVTDPNEQCDSPTAGCSNRAEGANPTCCFDGSIAGVAGAGLLSLDQGMAALVGCRLPNLARAAACDRRLQRAVLNVQDLGIAADVRRSTDLTRARRFMSRVEKRLRALSGRLARVTRAGGACAANAAALTNQTANAADLAAVVAAGL